MTDKNTRKMQHEHKAIGLLRGKTITNIFYTEEQGEHHYGEATYTFTEETNDNE